MTSAAPHTHPGELDPAMIRALRRSLLRWYRVHARDLPWRRTNDPYRIWLSEIMLQQTRVETVLPYYDRFLREFPNVRALAGAELDDVLRLWSGLGYYSRARNLHRAANQITHEHAGRFPRTARELQALAGVGRYTAGAIASIAFGEPAPLVDGNVKRVFARLFAIDAPLDETATQMRIWSLATELLAPRAPGDFNQALMELGAQICTPTAPHCDACPIRNHCQAKRENRQTELPIRGKRTKVVAIAAAAAAIRNRNRLLIVRRPETGLLAGLWRLPTVDLPNGRSSDTDATQDLARFLRDDMGMSVRIGEVLGVVEHVFTHRRLTLRVYAAAAPATRPERNAGAAWRWLTAGNAAEFAFATVDRKALALAGFAAADEHGRASNPASQGSSDAPPSR